MVRRAGVETAGKEGRVSSVPPLETHRRRLLPASSAHRRVDDTRLLSLSGDSKGQQQEIRYDFGLQLRRRPTHPVRSRAHLVSKRLGLDRQEAGTQVALSVDQQAPRAGYAGRQHQPLVRNPLASTDCPVRIFQLLPAVCQQVAVVRLLHPAQGTDQRSPMSPPYGSCFRRWRGAGLDGRAPGLHSRNRGLRAGFEAPACHQVSGYLLLLSLRVAGHSITSRPLAEWARRQPGTGRWPALHSAPLLQLHRSAPPYPYARDSAASSGGQSSPCRQ